MIFEMEDTGDKDEGRRVPFVAELTSLVESGSRAAVIDR